MPHSETDAENFREMGFIKLPDFLKGLEVRTFDKDPNLIEFDFFVDASKFYGPSDIPISEENYQYQLARVVRNYVLPALKLHGVEDSDLIIEEQPGEVAGKTRVVRFRARLKQPRGEFIGETYKKALQLEKEIVLRDLAEVTGQEINDLNSSKVRELIRIYFVNKYGEKWHQLPEAVKVNFIAHLELSLGYITSVDKQTVIREGDFHLYSDYLNKWRGVTDGSLYLEDNKTVMNNIETGLKRLRAFSEKVKSAELDAALEKQGISVTFEEIQAGFERIIANQDLLQEPEVLEDIVNKLEDAAKKVGDLWEMDPDSTKELSGEFYVAAGIISAKLVENKLGHQSEVA